MLPDIEPTTVGKEHRRGRRFFYITAIVYAVVMFVGAGFAGGVMVEKRAQSVAEKEKRAGQVLNKNAPPTFLGQDVDFQQFWNIWQKAREGYVHQPVNETQLFYGAIKGIVAALNDPYSEYFDPDEAAQFARELDGTFEGIGAEIGFRDSRLIIVAPLPGTPAEEAGVKAGDQILAIDGANTVGLSLDAAVSKIRGPKGSSVTLSIFREGWKSPKDFVIIREQIKVAPVKWKMVDAKGKDTTNSGVFGVITISQFNEDTVKEFDTAVREITVRDAKGVIVDLRNDPGGYLDAAVEVVGGWVNHEPAVIERESNGNETVFKPKRVARFDNMPTVVLANRGSASAAEIVTGALQDYGKAIFVGEKTFGKGSVQNYEELPDGSAIKLTIAEWLTPKGRSIDKQGLSPDVEVQLTDDDANAGKDPQLDKAVEILNEKTKSQK